MAQGAVASLPINGTAPRTAEEIHEILECEKIVLFRDAVFSGNHARIKVPSHLSLPNSSSPSSLTPHPNPPASQAVTTTNNTPVRNLEGSHNGYGPRSSNTPHPPGRITASMPMAVKAEINPVLLEKSDDLIKAEIQLQRQRLERVLGEQVAQRRLSLKAAQQTSESLPDFDISDVLSKALTIVHPSTTAETEHTVGDHVSASDSFDENTFYSSQHDTPEHSRASQEHRPHADISAHDIGLASLHLGNTASGVGSEPRDVVVSDMTMSIIADSPMQEDHQTLSSSLQHSSQTLSQPRPALGFHETDNTSRGQTSDEFRQDTRKSNAHHKPGTGVTFPVLDNVNGASRHPSRQIVDLANVQSRPPSGLSSGELAPSTYAEIIEPPIIRTREDVPTLAPQPARVSPLATARAPPILGPSMIADEGTPARAGSSQDSSTKGTKPGDKKKNKKNKKRKSSGKQPVSMDTPESPYIKPEPLSPSAAFAAPLSRPLKRQRQTMDTAPGLSYDEPSYDLARDGERGPMMMPTMPPRYKDHGPRRVYDRDEDERQYEQREAEPYTVRRIGRDDRQHQRIVSHEEYRKPQSYREPRSPSMHILPYSSNESRGIRAVSRPVTERRTQEPVRYYSDLQPRVNARMDLDRDRSRSPIMRDRRSPLLMPPPRANPTCILIDEYGNEWAVPVASRQSVAPIIRSGDDNRPYEGAPLRPVARAPIDIYEDDRGVYRKPTPSLSAMRRVITQPEQDIDYRSYRQRDYSARPETRTLPAEEYVRVREPAERRQMSHFEEVPREYGRIGSTRPEGVRYAAPREYVGRVQSVHPEALRQVHASSVRPEPRREMVAQAPFREFSVRPSDSESIRREFIPPRESSYAPTRPTARRLVSEADYIPRPGEAPQDLYIEEGRRDIVYR